MYQADQQSVQDNELWDDKEELLYAMREGVAPAELVELGTKEAEQLDIEDIRGSIYDEPQWVYGYYVNDGNEDRLYYVGINSVEVADDEPEISDEEKVVVDNSNEKLAIDSMQKLASNTIRSIDAKLLQMVKADIPAPVILKEIRHIFGTNNDMLVKQKLNHIKESINKSSETIKPTVPKPNTDPGTGKTWRWNNEKKVWEAVDTNSPAVEVVSS
jgi:hypothetical protein